MYKRPVTETAKLVDVYIQEWLLINNRDSAKPRDLMPYMVQKSVFNRDYREGLPLRKVLRELDQSGKLGLIRGLRMERQLANRRWFFDRVEIRDC